MLPLPSIFVIVLGLISVAIGVWGSSNETETRRLEDGSLSTYIIQLQHPEEGQLASSLEELSKWYVSFLPNNNSRRMVHAYQHALTGFAARLTAGEAKAMRYKAGVAAVHPGTILHLQTTHSPSFLGLNYKMHYNNQHGSVWSQSEYGNGMIIGMLDTGIMPSHASFNDSGMSTLPSTKWKGTCAFTGNPCNNKIIGGRTFLDGNGGSKEGMPLSDKSRHGTHTASTAAGNFVGGANIVGNALGTASGMAPLAHLAIYKVCGDDGNCWNSDIVAGIDAAIQDGVDVLSMSLGVNARDLRNDVIAIAEFRATRAGIFFCASAGNYGKVLNVPPWVLTVGASTMDRALKATAHLGNGLNLDGEALWQPNQSTPVTSLVYPPMLARGRSAFCETGSLQGCNATGKIVICEAGDRPDSVREAEKVDEVKKAGGIAMILLNAQNADYTIQFVEIDLGASMPVLRLSYVAALRMKTYIYSTTNPEAQITFHGTVYGNGNGIPPSPSVADFSSRGPHPLSPEEVMKPDIIAPGVEILAAAASSLDNPNSRLMFRMESGTSMSCPHLAGIAALLKKSHPDWSPAAIKSAIMTTAYRLNNIGKPITDETNIRPASAMDMGAGHVNPAKALDPGLVYDMNADDYIPYLCGSDGVDVGSMIGRKVNCSAVSIKTGSQLNYPAFSLSLLHINDTKTYTRTVTNVGPASSTYSALIIRPDGVTVSVKPLKLKFCKQKQNQTYEVTFRRTSNSDKPFTEGSLQWVSYLHTVTSPMLVLLSDQK